MWNTHFEAYIQDLDKKKPVLWTGDLNVAPTEKDLTNAKPNWNKTPGYTEAETSSFKRILDPPTMDETEAAPTKFVDVWRRLHPDDKHYTYFSYRFNCRSKGIGWRLDHCESTIMYSSERLVDMFSSPVVLSERIFDKVKMCEIRSEIYGASDHCPLVLEFEGEL